MTTKFRAMTTLLLIAALLAITPAGLFGDQADSNKKKELTGHDEFEQAAEQWEKQHGAKWEKWGKEQAAQWEKWSWQFGKQYETWAKEHEKAWEKWTTDYAEAWQAWGEGVERGEFDKEERDRLLKKNLEMLQEMPIDDLYEQVAKSTEQLKKMPLKDLQQMEDLVRESVERALGSLEDIRAESDDYDKEDWSAATDGVVKLLERVQGELDKKRYELQEVATEELSRFESVLSEMPDHLRANKAQLELLDKHLKQMKARQLGNLTEKAGQLEEMGKRLQADRASELKEIAREIAKDRQVKAEMDKEMEYLRSEIKELRAELKRLRGERPAEDE